jgi:glycosyltransferase involved in cell wall biosynthesis
MRVTAVTGGIPDPFSGGGALTAYTIVEHLVSRGDDVAVVATQRSGSSDPAGRSKLELVRGLEALGASVSLVDLDDPGNASRKLRARLGRFVSPSVRDAFSEIASAELVAEVVSETSPNAVFVYHFDALAASARIEAPRFVGVGDPAHLPLAFRWRETWPSARALRSAPSTLMSVRARRAAMPRLMNACAATGAFAAHHAAWFRAHGVPGCDYLRTPVPWVAAPEQHPVAAGCPRILMLGHLKGVVTLSGLQLAAQMLPLLEEELGPNGFDLAIVGGHEPPRDLATQLDRPSVTFSGHTTDPAAELRRADVFLVPNPIDLGVRVRIITGFAHAAAIVSHRANARGIPELEHGANAMLGSSPQELCQAVVAVANDRELSERLRNGARQTYERWFAPSVAASAIRDRLEMIASE